MSFEIRDTFATLPIAIVKEVGSLLCEGNLSNRKIAARLGISRSIVNAIADGRRGLHGKSEEGGKYSKRTPRSAPRRCPDCGYQVYLPCLICAMRERRQRKILLELLAADFRRQPKKRSDNECYLRAS